MNMEKTIREKKNYALSRFKVFYEMHRIISFIPLVCILCDIKLQSKERSDNHAYRRGAYSRVDRVGNAQKTV